MHTTLHETRVALLLGVSGLLVALAVPSPALAQTKSKSMELFFTGQLGIGDCDDTLCGPSELNTGPHLGLGGGVFLRPIPFLAFGAEMHWNALSVDEDIERDESGSYFLGGIAARGYLPLESIVEPWLGLGTGIALFDTSSLRLDRDREDELDLSGPYVGLQGGVDVNLTEMISIGGTMRLNFPFWEERCRLRVEPDRIEEDCRDVDSLDQEDADRLPDLLWFVGGTVRIDLAL